MALVRLRRNASVEGEFLSPLVHKFRQSIADAQIRANLIPGLYTIRKALRDCESLADVGCGDASPLRVIGFTGHTIGIDGYLPSVEASRRRKIHKEYILAGILETGLPSKSVDAAMALDVIEHLQKEQGDLLIRELERIARRRVLLITPNGFLPQEPKDGNQYQRHLSGWTPEDLQQRGFAVRGIYGLKALRGEWQDVSFRPRFIGWTLSKLSEPLVYKHPQRAAAVLAIKELAEDFCGLPPHEGS